MTGGAVQVVITMHQRIDYRFADQLKRKGRPFFPRHAAAIDYIWQFRTQPGFNQIRNQDGRLVEVLKLVCAVRKLNRRIQAGMMKDIARTLSEKQKSKSSRHQLWTATAKQPLTFQTLKKSG